MRTPIHWPDRSGHFESSKALATAQVASSASPIAPSAFRSPIVFPLVLDSFVAPRAAGEGVEADVCLRGKRPAEVAAPADGTLPVGCGELGVFPSMAAWRGR